MDAAALGRRNCAPALRRGGRSRVAGAHYRVRHRTRLRSPRAVRAATILRRTHRAPRTEAAGACASQGSIALLPYRYPCATVGFGAEGVGAGHLRHRRADARPADGRGRATVSTGCDAALVRSGGRARCAGRQERGPAAQRGGGRRGQLLGCARGPSSPCRTVGNSSGGGRLRTDDRFAARRREGRWRIPRPQ